MRILPILVGLSLLLWLLGGAWWMSNNRRDCLGFDTTANTNVQTPPKIAPQPTITNAFTISDEGFSASAPKGILFETSDNTPLISTATNTALEQLTAYLKSNTDRKLTLLGNYKSEEENNTSFLNLGLARAGAVKEQLVKMGLDASRIELIGKREDAVKMSNDTLLNALAFRFDNISTLNSDAAITNLKSEILADPAIIYFATNSANVALNDTFRTRIQNLKTYLRSVEGSTVTVSGHTDNVGNRNSNIILSEKRAAQVKQYLMRQGFEANRVNVIGKGPDTPIADNSTTEGKAKNRRVEIQLDK